MARRAHRGTYKETASRRNARRTCKCLLRMFQARSLMQCCTLFVFSSPRFENILRPISRKHTVNSSHEQNSRRRNIKTGAAKLRRTAEGRACLCSVLPRFVKGRHTAGLSAGVAHAFIPPQPAFPVRYTPPRPSFHPNPTKRYEAQHLPTSCA